jgi:hypothetical protein
MMRFPFVRYNPAINLKRMTRTQTEIRQEVDD